jgi:predicted pyridoxine 5'-phosphate oxidase superfamily flavin-nucleotide-binding protein
MRGQANEKARYVFSEKVAKFLKQREFISVATCDLQGRPNAASKFLLKLENNCIYLVDYTIGRTWENLKINPRASLSFTDTDNLTGYQINGSVEIFNRGCAQYEKMLKEIHARKTSLSAKRIIEGVSSGKKHATFELMIPDNFVIFKVSIEEVVEIGLGGSLKRERLNHV